MAYGIEVYGSDGELVYDLSQSGWTLVDSWVAPAGANASQNYPEWSEYEIRATNVLHERSGGHTISISGTTVTAVGITLPAHFVIRTCASTVFVFVR